MTRMRLGALVMVLIVTACSSEPRNSSPDTTVPSVPTVNDWATTLTWKECGSGIDCSSLEVPFDYSKPDLGSFILPVARHRATQPASRIGTLLVNPGGPGSAATDWASYAVQVLSSSIVERFDIVAWDPRGVGGSDPAIDCVDTMDDYFGLDPSPDNDDELKSLVEGAKDFADSCAARSGKILTHVGTIDAARDMDVLRRALGEEQISFAGFSYGTKLGATWATLFPTSVRAAVFDGAIDPILGYVDDLILQARGFETSLNTFLDQCDVNQCSFMQVDETARQAFDRILLEIDKNPLICCPTRPPTNQGVAHMGIGVTLYASYRWGELEDALSAASSGDGQPLLILFDDYFGRQNNGFIDNSIDAYIAITCADRDEQLTPQDILGLESRLQNVAPRLGASWIQEMMICAHWTTPTQGGLSLRADTANRILVVGSIGDAATPLSGTRQMATTLGHARLVVSQLEQHTTYGSDPCVTQIVDEYLLTLSDGPDITNC